MSKRVLQRHRAPHRVESVRRVSRRVDRNFASLATYGLSREWRTRPPLCARNTENNSKAPGRTYDRPGVFSLRNSTNSLQCLWWRRCFGIMAHAIWRNCLRPWPCQRRMPEAPIAISWLAAPSPRTKACHPRMMRAHLGLSPQRSTVTRICGAYEAAITPSTPDRLSWHKRKGMPLPSHLRAINSASSESCVESRT